MIIDFLSGLLALSYFVLIATATRQHFSSDQFSMGMNIISIVSLVGILSFQANAFMIGLELPFVSIVGTLTALALFLWSVRHSDKKRLPLAFDPNGQADAIITSGPWRYIRHPFYVSYLLFWLASAISGQHFTVVTAAITLAFIYGYSAFREEKQLCSGEFKEEYLAYRERTGAFFPLLYKKGKVG